MKLFLTSTGIVDEVKKDFLSVLKKSPSQLKLAFIPTAGYEPNDLSEAKEEAEISQKADDTGLIRDALNSLYDLGFEVIEIDIQEKSKGELVKELSNIDVIYVNAGNTYYLMDCMNRCNFKEVLDSLPNKNKILYVGSSAGSIVAGPDISVAGWHPNWDKNLIGIKDFSGLGLTNIIIAPHFIDSDREVFALKAKESNYPIIALNNRQAIYIDNNLVKLSGDHEKVSYQAPTFSYF